MLDVGLLGLDTSHPPKFADLLSAHPDARVTAVWDGRDVRDDAFVAEFCEEHGATERDDPADLLGDVDAAMVLTVNWDAHADLAVPFLEAGVPTFVDKPLAGTAADLDRIGEAAAAGGASLVGGSSLPFHPDVSALGDASPRTLFAAGYNDPFYYGVHLTDAVRSLVDGDWTRVEPVPGPGTAVGVDFAEGSRAALELDGPTEEAAFGLLDVSDRTRVARVGSAVGDLEAMYEPFVEAFVAAARGERDDGQRLLDGARLLLAVQAALERERAVEPGDDAVRAVDEDGAAFLADYEPYY